MEITEIMNNKKQNFLKNFILSKTKFLALHAVIAFFAMNLGCCFMKVFEMEMSLTTAVRTVMVIWIWWNQMLIGSTCWQAEQIEECLCRQFGVKEARHLGHGNISRLLGLADKHRSLNYGDVVLVYEATLTPGCGSVITSSCVCGFLQTCFVYSCNNVSMLL